jgi:myo-inositol-1-phosphate synthase
MIGKRVCSECIHSTTNPQNGYACNKNATTNYETGVVAPGSCKHNKNGACKHYKVDRDKVNRRLQDVLKRTGK